MTTDSGDDVLAATLIQIAAHAERIASLDTREHGHHDHLAAQISELATDNAAMATRIGTIDSTLTRHTTIVNALDGLDTQVATLSSHLTELAANSDDAQANHGYQPVPPPRWWQLTGPERDTALSRLRAWVTQIYQPGYGQLAATLPACWEHHPICLYTLDWLSELWSVLYLGNRTTSTLAAQGEWQTRLLPAAADQMATRPPAAGTAPGRGWPSSLPGLSRAPGGADDHISPSTAVVPARRAPCDRERQALAGFLPAMPT
jgi:hypothetical protein